MEDSGSRGDNSGSHNYIRTTYQSDAGSAGIFARRTNLTQEVRVYSHNVPIRRRKYGYIRTTYQAGSAGIFSRRT
eukprot:2586808-Pyramimonas_sp.AAC.1